ncbi:hypothetical protein IGI04_013914 [Brassica rapa subsp. trilocularis]|uniref:Uncharacterized protein n=1 Tax=Brassica rapa subsp. trilocularis TaxID=1813537 RepID=A0ABQ7NA62_BRACM|nr:hypothetical protein IGI04_013914 [Brassica rapa subsp. trilocularis]
MFINKNEMKSNYQSELIKTEAQIAPNQEQRLVFSETPSPSPTVCGVESDGAAYETAEAMEASTDLVESSSSGYRSAWRETRRVKIGRWIALAPARSTTPARSTKASMGRAPQRRCVVAVGVVSTGRKRSG